MPQPEELSFESRGERCAALRYRAGGDGPRPCVVMAHGFGGTMDSGLAPFAERLAAAGYDALTFDYRHFGRSGGEPRQLLAIKRQHEDIHAALACARSLDGIDAARVALWGTSYAGGHVVAVAADDERVAAVVSQVPAMDGLAAMRALIGYAGLGQAARLTAAGVRDVVASLRGAEPVTVPLVGPPGTVGAMTSEDAEAGYRAIAGPSWRNEVCARVMLQAGSYRPGRKADRLPCPILIQIADRDTVAPAEAAEAAGWRAKGRAEVRRYPIGHFEVYGGEAFERAVADQIHFLGRHVGAAEQGTRRRFARSGAA